MNDSASLQEKFAFALANASALLSERSDARLTLRSFRVRLAADFPDVSEADHVDVVAGVAQRFSGALRGTSIFTMEPEGALDWSRSLGGAASEPEQVISTFVSQASSVLCDLVRAAGQAMHGGEVEFDRASFRENSRVAIVLGTHAPSDTAVATLGFDIEFAGSCHRAHVDLLLEPKLLAGQWAGAES